MMSAKIGDAAVETAISAAADSLANNPNIAWIRESALVQRAYFLGLFEGLAAIAEEDAIGNRLVPLLAGTFWSKSADDTFPSTQLGRHFAALEARLRGIETGISWDRHSIDSVLADIRHLDCEWRSCVEASVTLLGKIESAAVGLKHPIGEGARGREGESEELRRIKDCMSDLDMMMRYMALLETHHELDKRF
jgi:hypothetical protein